MPIFNTGAEFIKIDEDGFKVTINILAISDQQDSDYNYCYFCKVTHEKEDYITQTYFYSLNEDYLGRIYKGVI